MAGLIDTIRGAISPDTVDGLARNLGESSQNTSNALNSVIPIILAAMAGRVESGNVGSVVDMIRSALSGGNPIDRQLGLANPAAPGVAPDDGGLASGLLGSSMGSIASTLADRFGVKAESLRSLLGVGSLLGAGGIARALNGDVTQQGLSDLLRRERPAISAALPAGVSGLLGGFGNAASGAASSAGAAASETAAEVSSGMGRWWPWLLLALIAAAVIFGLRTCSHDGVNTTTVAPAETTGPVVDNSLDVTAPAPVAPIPTGSGVVSESRDGRPALVVYFDVAKSEVSKDLSTAAADVKAYLDTHAGSTLAVSGFNDPTGNAAANAALSKRRAEEVSKALTATGIPAASIKLEKPAATTGTGDTNAESRRVEVTVRD